MPSQRQRIDAWVSEPQNTARSVIATIFGDTVSPLGGSIWLAQLFQLTEVFGFSPRLVRTSLYRLAGEDWCTNERVGRQSRYSLTEAAAEETRRAEQRIYTAPDPHWSGEWTAVFVDSPTVDHNVRQSLTQSLGWQGFLPLRAGLLVSPTATIRHARDACSHAAPGTAVPLATMAFPELDELVADGFFAEALSIEDRAKAYNDFIALYEPLAASDRDNDPARGFAIRTMLVHDLRRIRLSGPDIPAQLLRDDWPGRAAFDLAQELYPKLCAATSPWLSSIFEGDYPATFKDRF